MAQRPTESLRNKAGRHFWTTSQTSSRLPDRPGDGDTDADTDWDTDRNSSCCGLAAGFVFFSGGHLNAGRYSRGSPLASGKAAMAGRYTRARPYKKKPASMLFFKERIFYGWRIVAAGAVLNAQIGRAHV